MLEAISGSERDHLQRHRYPDGSNTTFASIEAMTGVSSTPTWHLGTVKITATVAADDTYRGATTSHTLAILTPANLAFSSAPERLRPGSDQTAGFSVTRDGTGEVTWSIVESDPAAMINGSDDGNGLVTAGATVETITVQATVSATVTHATETITTTLTH